MKKIIVILALCLVICLLLCSCEKVSYIEKEEVEVTVTDKIYKSAYTSWVYNGKFSMPIHHPARHYVYAKYQELEKCIDSVELFDGCEVGSKFCMTLVNKYSEEHELIDQELIFEE